MYNYKKWETQRLRKRKSQKAWQKRNGESMKFIDRDHSRVLENGYTENQTYIGLKKGWKGYIISKCLENDPERMSYYASAIQKLESELGISLANFPHLRIYALGHKKDYAKYLEDELYVDKVTDPERIRSRQSWMNYVWNSDGVERMKTD